MGFFSWRSIVSGHDIMNDYGNDDMYDGIALLLPDNTIIEGEYDGYGSVGGQHIYDLVDDIKEIRVMLRGEVEGHIKSGKTYNDYKPSEHAEGQGHWISSYETRVKQPTED